MIDLRMTREEFWTIVDQTGWRGLVASGVRRPYEEGGKRMLKLLPTIDDMEDFCHHFEEVRGQLTQALDQYEQETGKRVPVSDDGWSDLSSMVIGLGRVEFEKNLKDPSLLLKRANTDLSTIHGYVESFSYCIPFKDAYDPVPLKLARAVNSLRHWQEKVKEAGDDVPSYMVTEVERRQLEVDELRVELERTGEEEWTQERYQEHVEAEQRKYEELQEQRRQESMKLRKDKEKAKAEFLKKYGSWD